MNLKQYYGIGFQQEKNIKNIFGINDRIRSSLCRLNEKITEKVDLNIANNYVLNRKLYNEKRDNVNFYKNINCYRGIRHKNKYPVRGQRTHTNATKKYYKFRHFA